MIRRSQRVRGVLDKNDAVALRERTQPRKVSRSASIVHRDYRLRTRGYCCLDRVRIDAKSIRPHIGEYNRPALVTYAIGSRHEGQRWNDYFVSWSNVRDKHRSVECRCAIAYGDSMPSLGAFSDSGLEFRDLRAAGQPVRSQHIGNGRNVVFID